MEKAESREKQSEKKEHDSRRSRHPTISPSQLEAMSCRLAWHLGYRCGYRSIRPSVNLELGTGIHQALEGYYGKKEDPIASFTKWAKDRIETLAATFDDDIQELREAEKLGKVMLEGYLKEYDGKDDFDVITTEHTLSKKLPVPETGKLSPCHLVARLDAIVRDHNTGHLFSLEHKTFSRFTISNLELDHQFCSQVWLGQDMAQDMGVSGSVVGVIYNGLRKQAPGPKVKLKLFERHKIYKTSRHIEVFLHRAYWQYKETSKKGLPIYPQPNNLRCGGCDFREVCAEYQRGGDWKFILKEQFTQRVPQ